MRLVLTNYDLTVKGIDTSEFYLGMWVKSADIERTIPYYNSDSSYLLGTWNEIERSYQLFLKELSLKLNKHHSTDHTYKYWETIIGTWLFSYIAVLYDRYMICKTLQNSQLNDIQIAFAKEELPVIPDYNSFNVMVYQNDRFNYNLFVDIFDFLQIPYTVLGGNRPEEEYYKFNANYGIKNKVLYSFNRFVKFMRFPKRFISASGLSSLDLFLVTLGSKFRVFPLFFQKNVQPHIELRQPDNLISVEISENISEFNKYIKSRIALDIPTCYIENFKSNLDEMRKQYPMNLTPSTKMFSKLQDTSEHFKMFIAAITENGGGFYGYQHGGYYGMLKYKQQEYLEIRVSDKYYTWGQDSTFFETDTRIVPFYALKLSKLKKVDKNNDKISKVIFLGANFNYYLYEYETYYLGPLWKNYYRQQTIFFENLNIDIRNILRDRVYGFYADEKKREKNFTIPWLCFDNERKMLSHINSNTVFIIDYPGTTFFEVLTANVPSVLYWNRDMFVMRDGVEGDLNLLREHKILFDSPVEASKYLNEGLDIVKENWYKSSTQQAISSFLKKYANSSKYSTKFIYKELL